MGAKRMTIDYFPCYNTALAAAAATSKLLNRKSSFQRRWGYTQLDCIQTIMFLKSVFTRKLRQSDRQSESFSCSVCLWFFVLWRMNPCLSR